MPKKPVSNFSKKRMDQGRPNKNLNPKVLGLRKAIRSKKPKSLIFNNIKWALKEENGL